MDTPVCESHFLHHGRGCGVEDRNCKAVPTHPPCPVQDWLNFYREPKVVEVFSVGDQVDPDEVCLFRSVKGFRLCEFNISDFTSKTPWFFWYNPSFCSSPTLDEGQGRLVHLP